MNRLEKELEATFRYSVTQFFGAEGYRLHKHHADQFTGAGHADFYGHLGGKYVELELKVQPNSFEVEQQNHIRECNRTQGFGAGILQLKDGTVWLVLGAAFLPKFSYRERQFWLPLLDVPVPAGADRVLNLTPLKGLLRK